MSTEDTTPTPAPAKPRIGGLGPKAQKLQALRDKMAAQANGGSTKNFSHNSPGGSNAKGAAGHKKTNFQRKAT
jgi:hypothetical protein